ncbi:2-oxo-4-hydroxy-4-carboxy-5-ureidoimidazoline decarboxylase [Gorillibacterium sp. sgz5001074]|uniref:2-oxo-4-hydroxy-4-carboxy-5-ureidoimidazoline decarboxylase n=1 Tax=Gorillibacterium sp. sgz5001074 TaxID=3446695 RepID=UPI003F66FD79
MGRWTLRELNGWDREEFAARLGGLFEHSPWVAEEAWLSRPFSSAEELHGAMLQVVDEAGGEAQLTLLRAHPDLGARIAMTDDSRKEQSGAGLDRLDRREYRYLLALNRLYKAKFGFPFIIAVKGKSKEDIIASMRERCRSGREAELARALQEVGRITRFRLEDAVSPD